MLRNPSIRRRAGLVLCLFALALFFTAEAYSDGSPRSAGKTTQTRQAFNATQRHSSRHPFEGYTSPFRSIEVAASDAGRVAEVGVKRGDIVKKGQLLLRLDSTVLQASRRVSAADAVASAKVSALAVEHELRLDRLRQFQTLSDDGGSSEQELRRAKADEQVAMFHLEEAREQQKKAQLTLDEIDTRIAAHSILSPIQGVVTHVEKDVGEFVSPTQPEVVTIVDLSQLRATFYLTTSDAMRVVAGQKANLLMPETSQQVVSVIEYVAATTAADSGRVRVDVLIDNQHRTHRSGLRCLLQLPKTAAIAGIRPTQPKPESTANSFQ